ncbi:DUF58 domain-containing protein [Marichromatium gracile]|uniref:DUF58 domain-containing protein n=2 Tax=Marichromatium TaxID=85076 RepID=UPI001F1D3551|nr:DUF58 domain-containing protein [Marichromatium gracile]MCF1184454.1 DUF58 domain-containing protein [Marichromatium gracile]
MPETSALAVGVAELVGLRARASGLDLAPRARVLAARGGAHPSRLRGRGMEFAESRPYQPGDEPRHMDWRVTARAGEAHVKCFREERERPVWLCVDQRATMRFATRVAFKSVIAARVAALLGWAALARGDRVGGLVFDDHAIRLHPPAARARGLLALFESLAAPAAASAETAMTLQTALARLDRVVRPGALVVLVSDLAGLGAGRDPSLTRLGRGAELVWVQIEDVLECEPPPPGRYPVLAAGRRGWLDLRGSRRRAAWAEARAAAREQVVEQARAHRAHLLRLRTDQDPAAALARGLGLRPGWGR